MPVMKMRKEKVMKKVGGADKDGLFLQFHHLTRLKVVRTTMVR
jgi:hypothetical protein